MLGPSSEAGHRLAETQAVLRLRARRALGDQRAVGVLLSGAGSDGACGNLLCAYARTRRLVGASGGRRPRVILIAAGKAGQYRVARGRLVELKRCLVRQGVLVLVAAVLAASVPSCNLLNDYGDYVAANDPPMCPQGTGGEGGGDDGDGGGGGSDDGSGASGGSAGTTSAGAGGAGMSSADVGAGGGEARRPPRRVRRGGLSARNGPGYEP